MSWRCGGKVFKDSVSVSEDGAQCGPALRWSIGWVATPSQPRDSVVGRRIVFPGWGKIEATGEWSGLRQ